MTYRVDSHQPQNVYRDQQYIGVMFTAEDAALVVEALNGTEPPADGEEFALLDPAERAAARAATLARLAAPPPMEGGAFCRILGGNEKGYAWEPPGRCR